MQSSESPYAERGPQASDQDQNNQEALPLSSLRIDDCNQQIPTNQNSDLQDVIVQEKDLEVNDELLQPSAISAISSPDDHHSQSNSQTVDEKPVSASSLRVSPFVP